MFGKSVKFVLKPSTANYLFSARKCSVSKTASQRNESNGNSGQTHFGFEAVDEDLKSEKVYEVFEKVADNYDLMNDAMSFGIHRIWKHLFISRLNPPHGTHLLDVAGGSGDIAFRYLDFLKKQPNPDQRFSRVTVCDINESMLSVGKNRAEKLGYTDENKINWVLGDAENLPIESDSIDAYTISFGIRNVTHIDRTLNEAYRVLKPGGRFMCLEFSRVNNEIIRKIYDSYSFTVIPVMGQILAGQWKPYQYLVESIRKFPDQETFKNMIRDAGFRLVTYENLTFGTVAIHSGFKL